MQHPRDAASHSPGGRHQNRTTTSRSANIVGKRMRLRREELGLSQEKVGVRIGIDESSSRARISRYELGTHEPPVETARLIAEPLGVPLASGHICVKCGFYAIWIVVEQLLFHLRV
ncbi:helix-turn-helix transcriptional regulator [Xenophilus sp. Marseille-Q4582]|uniref:helix-turn-helix domain-containing protein n=1 Tax=Xenophilus sp. Marseille-Q4582 TaxID=2866600 RepID=UPI001CE4A7CA